MEVRRGRVGEGLGRIGSTTVIRTGFGGKNRHVELLRVIVKIKRRKNTAESIKNSRRSHKPLSDFIHIKGGAVFEEVGHPWV